MPPTATKPSKNYFPSKERHLRTPTRTFEVRTPITKAIWEKKTTPPPLLSSIPRPPRKKIRKASPRTTTTTARGASCNSPMVLPKSTSRTTPSPPKRGHGKWEMMTFVRVKPIKNFFVSLPTLNFESRTPPPPKKRGGRWRSIVVGFIFLKNLGWMILGLRVFFLCLPHLEVFPRAKSPRPVRLAGVKGLLRVGGGFVQRGGGGGCLMGEGGFLGWPRSPSPPPFKRTKGGRGVC